MLTAKMISDFVEKNRDEAIRCFQEIIQTPSETGNEEAVSFVFERWMKDNGMEVVEDPDLDSFKAAVQPVYDEYTQYADYLARIQEAAAAVI